MRYPRSPRMGGANFSERATERTVVIGGGVAGAAVLAALARAGSDAGEVVLLEGATRLGAHSSGRSAAIFRPAVDDPLTRALALRTLSWLEAAESRPLGRRLLDPVGLVVLEGQDLADPPPAWAQDLTAAGLAEPLDAAGLAERAPHFAPRGARAWWLPRAGRVAAHALVQTLVQEAERHGARVETGARVAGLLTEDGRVTGVRLADGAQLAAETVVLAAGAWSKALGAAVGAEAQLAASTRHLFVARRAAHGDRSDPQPAIEPRLPVVWDDAAGFYVRPYDGELLVCACDKEPADPDAVAPRYTVDQRVERRALELAEAHLAPLGGPLVLSRGWRGLRDVGAGDRPVLGPDPRVPGLAWCAGLGGHGFSIGVAAGEEAARQILAERALRR